MKKILFVVALFCSAIFVEAQNELPSYQRNSLHLILLTTDEPTIGNGDFAKQLADMWQAYPFPDKYDKHDINLKQAYGGKPKGSLMELIVNYRGKLDNLSLEELKEISATIADAKTYKQDLINNTQVILKEKKVGQQLISKWYGIKDDGSYSFDLLLQRSSYNASQADVADAKATTRGLQAITDQAEDLIANTFVVFSKLAFYENEPVAAFSKDVATKISGFAGTLGAAGVVAAETAYAAVKNGYSASATSILYRLQWNDSIKVVFYDAFEGDKINMAKFNAIEFPFEMVGAETSTSSTFDAKGGLSEMVGIESNAIPSDTLIQKTLYRNIDKVLSKMQRHYDVFRPLVPVISVEPLLVDAGMKESITDKDKFELLEGLLNPKNNKVEYKRIALLSVVKGKVWDNRYSLTDEKVENEVKGTELKKNKKVSLGMLVRVMPSKK